jgi:hypothetical protein
MIAPSQHLTNSYGNGIQCQGPILTVTPYVNRSKSWQLPFEDYYGDPVYDLSDRDDNGILDNPGSVLYEMPTRTGQKDSHNWSGGLSMQVTIPLMVAYKHDAKRWLMPTSNCINKQLPHEDLSTKLQDSRTAGN